MTGGVSAFYGVSAFERVFPVKQNVFILHEAYAKKRAQTRSPGKPAHPLMGFSAGFPQCDLSAEKCQTSDAISQKAPSCHRIQSSRDMACVVHSPISSNDGRR